ncbi:hypothetical protein LP419_39700 [Massilia sp. H-1]|nr:hypothetical protein LP419_39700 [Massilia sp. H-1]
MAMNWSTASTCRPKHFGAWREDRRPGHDCDYRPLPQYQWPDPERRPERRTARR